MYKIIQHVYKILDMQHYLANTLAPTVNTSKNNDIAQQM